MYDTESADSPKNNLYEGEIYRRRGKSPWIVPIPLTKYLSTTEHKERQVVDTMHLRT